MRVSLLFQHGWALTAHTYRAWVDALLQHFAFDNAVQLLISVADRGYFGPADPCPASPMLGSDLLVVVCHSLGLHLVDREALSKADYLLCLSSFANFHRASSLGMARSRKLIHRMLRKLESSPEDVLRDFWGVCLDRDSDRPCARTINREVLMQDLEVLDKSDFEAGRLSTKAHASVLHGGKDRLVSLEQGLELTDILGAGKVEIFNESGHDLPLSQGHFGVCLLIEFIEQSLVKRGP